MSKKIFIGNLNFKATEDELEEMFSKFGEIEECIVLKDKNTGRSKGFGFITFVNDADADKAIAEMNEKEFEGRKLSVNEASEREERPRRDFGHRGSDERSMPRDNMHWTTKN